MKKHYKIEVYSYEDQKWWTRFANHKNFSSLDDAKQQLNLYDAPTRIVEVSETVVETHDFLNQEDLTELLKDCPILVSENYDMYTVFSINPSHNEFKLKCSTKSKLYIFLLDEVFVANGKLNVKDTCGRRIEFSYYKNILLE